jgi:hemimethylated DNA binding protein
VYKDLGSSALQWEELPATLRHEFDLGKGSPEEIDICFELLREINKISSSLDENRAQRKEHARREGIEFSVGEVVKHKKYGYRMVVYGWDSLPRMEFYTREEPFLRQELWRAGEETEDVEGLPSGADQPFYYCVPDQQDTSRKFGAPSRARYVAQENIERVTDRRLMRVHHPLMGRCFDGFNSDAGVFVPVQHIQHQFPDDYATLVTPADAHASSERLLCTVSALQGALALQFAGGNALQALLQALQGINIDEGTAEDHEGTAEHPAEHGKLIRDSTDKKSAGNLSEQEIDTQCGGEETQWWKSSTMEWADTDLVTELLKLGGCTWANFEGVVFKSSSQRKEGAGVDTDRLQYGLVERLRIEVPSLLPLWFLIALLLSFVYASHLSCVHL